MTQLHKLFLMAWLLLGFSALTLAQNTALNNGKIPALKQSHVPYIHIPTNTDTPGDMAYGSDQTNTLSMPLPAGTPLTNIGTWTPPVFASSGVRGGDLNYYFVDAGPPPQLYQFDEGTGSVTLIGAITGMASGASVNGIAYDGYNDTYYLCGGVFASTNNLYSLDMGTLTATLIASFPNATGAMIDIAINAATGVGYGYDLITDDAWTFDPETGATTLLGSLGYDANYGQGMDIDQATGTIYLSAFNNTTFTGQLRTMDPGTGATTMLADWGLVQVAPFAINNEYGPQLGPGPATDPNPVSGATDVDLNQDISWTNPAGATSIEVFFGTSPGSLTSVYSGTPISTYDPGTLTYFTTYYWKVNETDGTGTTSGSTWNFKTMQNPLIGFDSIKVYPQDVAMWTGNTEGTTKTDGEINTVFPNVGWSVFDLSSIDGSWMVDSIQFFGYVNATNWPYWSATPMGSVNPITDDAATINNQIQPNGLQGTAYLFQNEASTFSVGWHVFYMDPASSYLADFDAARSQGWFAMGFLDRDGSATYFVNFDGHNTANMPYLEVYYHYITPVELTSFTAAANNGNVTLNWATATETNNKGFEVQKSNGSEFQTIGFVQGNGTSTQQHSYSYTDNNVAQGNYSYRLRQVDFDGTSEYSPVVEVNVNTPAVFNLAQNYPNPFNPSTKINYSLKVDSKVTLQVFDILGQKVATLLNENIAAGNHNVTFDASKINSGVYLYRIEATGVDGSSFTSVKKMILTK